MISLQPYLVYKGNCEAAFNFYKSVFGAKEPYFGRYEDVPPEARKLFPNAPDNSIMHATLTLNDNTVILGNDNPELLEQLTQPFARDFYLHIVMDELNEAIRVFNQLSVGGKVVVPVAATFWASCYGVLTDKFGINWKITSHFVG